MFLEMRETESIERKRLEARPSPWMGYCASARRAAMRPTPSVMSASDVA